MAKDGQGPAATLPAGGGGSTAAAAADGSRPTKRPRLGIPDLLLPPPLALPAPAVGETRRDPDVPQYLRCSAAAADISVHSAAGHCLNLVDDHSLGGIRVVTGTDRRRREAVMSWPPPPPPAAAAAGVYRCHWRTQLGRCVDAAPIVVDYRPRELLPGEGAASTAYHSVVYACSHDGDVVCLGLDTGKSIWHTRRVPA